MAGDVVAHDELAEALAKYEALDHELTWRTYKDVPRNFADRIQATAELKACRTKWYAAKRRYEELLAKHE